MWYSVLEFDLYYCCSLSFNFKKIEYQYYNTLDQILSRLKNNIKAYWRNWYLYFTLNSYEEIDKAIWNLIDRYNLRNYLYPLPLNDIQNNKVRECLFKECQKYAADFFVEEKTKEYEMKLSEFHNSQI